MTKEYNYIKKPLIALLIIMPCFLLCLKLAYDIAFTDAELPAKAYTSFLGLILLPLLGIKIYEAHKKSSINTLVISDKSIAFGPEGEQTEVLWTAIETATIIKKLSHYAFDIKSFAKHHYHLAPHFHSDHYSIDDKAFYKELVKQSKTHGFKIDKV
ncbi:hypothetical protein [Flocculibacter collagenilyticus]|uniref:hypothetical protein n=1 Tax=Flocculibacter collagenilyticus TaxID=2744479 RepID=UPI0018F488F9|nr:hypothetical protein [Flocculibacter collagenilyticus]